MTVTEETMKPADLRKEKIRLRRMLPEEQRIQKSAAIAERLMKENAWQRAEILLIYVSRGFEVSTKELIVRALDGGKKVFCPKVEGESMEFYRIFSPKELQAGFRGILEPEGNTAAFGMQDGQGSFFVCPRRADCAGEEYFRERKPHVLLVAPGTVFDREGHRIGYGGGYYDRYLGRIPEADRPYCIGLCFACQLAGQIRPGPHDIKMDSVIFA